MYAISEILTIHPGFWHCSFPLGIITFYRNVPPSIHLFTFYRVKLYFYICATLQAVKTDRTYLVPPYAGDIGS